MNIQRDYVKNDQLFSVCAVKQTEFCAYDFISKHSARSHALHTCNGDIDPSHQFPLIAELLFYFGEMQCKLDVKIL